MAPRAARARIPTTHPSRLKEHRPAALWRGRGDVVDAGWRRELRARDQWLSRGTPNFLWIFWYLTAGFSTMPSESSPTILRWISCQGVWLFGYL